MELQRNKKVLFFVPKFPVLSETFIEREIAKLAQRGKLSVTVLSLEKHTGTISPELQAVTFYARLNLSGCLKGFFLIIKDLRVFLALSLLMLKNPNRNFIGNIYLLLKAYGYASIFSSFSPDHIHAQFLSESSTLVLLISKILRVPFSISAHARDVFGKSQDPSINPELVKQKVKDARFITICNRKAWKACVEQSGEQNPRNIILQYHGLDVEALRQEYSEVSEITASDMKTDIVSIGRLVEKKGFKYLIDALAILNEEGEVIQTRIIGPGPLYAELKNMIAQKHLESSVQILGDGQGLPNSAVLRVLNTAKLFVLPSIETRDKDAEGIPNTLMEAALFKIPIVTTLTGSIQEFFKNGDNALVVPPQDACALAEAIKTLLTDKILASKLSGNAYHLVTDKFNLDVNIQDLETRLLQI